MLDNKALYQQILQFTEDEIKGLTNNQQYPVFKTQEDYVDPGDYPTPEPSAPSPSATPDVTPTPTPQPTPCLCDSNSGWSSAIPENSLTDQQITSFNNSISSHNQTVSTWFSSYNKFLDQSNLSKISINENIAKIETQKTEILEMADILQRRKPLECDIIRNSKRIKQLKEDIDTYYRQMTIIGNNNMSDMKSLKITPSKPTMNSPSPSFENALRCYKTQACQGSGYDKDFFIANRLNLTFVGIMRNLINGFIQYKNQWELWRNSKKEKMDLLLDNARLRKQVDDLDQKFGLVSLFTINNKAKSIQADIKNIQTSIQEYNTRFAPVIEQLSTGKDNINANAVNLTESLPEIQTIYNETERVETICPVNGEKLTCFKYETIQQATSFAQVQRADIGLGVTVLDKIDPPVFNSPVVVVDKCV